MLDRQLNQTPSKRKFVLALVAGLLLAQWLVFTHVHEQKGNSSDSLCAFCLTGQHFSHAVGDTPLVITRQPALRIDFFALSHIVLQPLFPAFHSRAPPVLL
ncbi:MAG: hypothetical protein PVJ39_16990 [Gammaproteobacteria bacterium]|jgi:hypothetical protein